MLLPKLRNLLLFKNSYRVGFFTGLFALPILPFFHSDGESGGTMNSSNALTNIGNETAKSLPQGQPGITNDDAMKKQRSEAELYILKISQQINRLLGLQVKIWRTLESSHGAICSVEGVKGTSMILDSIQWSNAFSTDKYARDGFFNSNRTELQNLCKAPLFDEGLSQSSESSSIEKSSGSINGRITVSDIHQNSVAGENANSPHSLKEDSNGSTTKTKVSLLQELLQDAAATVIQSHVRGLLARTQYKPRLEVYTAQKRCNDAACMIQSAWRAYSSKKQETFEALVLSVMKKREIAAVIIQRCWRHWQDKSQLIFEERVHCIMNIRSIAASIVQTAWRGYRTRCIVDEEWQDWVIKWSWDSPDTIVEVVGDFSNPPWMKRYLMKYCRIRKCFILRLKRKVGRYELKFLVDGRYVCDGGQVVISDGAGHYNNLVIVGEANQPPLEKIRKNLRALKTNLTLLSTTIRGDSSYSSMDTPNEISWDESHLGPDTSVEGTTDHVQATLDSQKDVVVPEKEDFESSVLIGMHNMKNTKEHELSAEKVLTADAGIPEMELKEKIEECISPPSDFMPDELRTLDTRNLFEYATSYTLPEEVAKGGAPVKDKASELPPAMMSFPDNTSLTNAALVEDQHPYPYEEDMTVNSLVQEKGMKYVGQTYLRDETLSLRHGAAESGTCVYVEELDQLQNGKDDGDSCVSSAVQNLGNRWSMGEAASDGMTQNAPELDICVSQHVKIDRNGCDMHPYSYIESSFANENIEAKNEICDDIYSFGIMEREMVPHAVIRSLAGTQIEPPYFQQEVNVMRNSLADIPDEMLSNDHCSTQHSVFVTNGSANEINTMRSPDSNASKKKAWKKDWKKKKKTRNS